MTNYRGTNGVNRIAAESVFPFEAPVFMDGLGGNDTLTGAFLHSNTIRGGSGNDSIEGGAQSNYLFGDAGQDILDAWITDDYSEFRGGTGNDTLTGGDGGNLLDGGPGVDLATGGDGLDIYVVNALRDQISESYVPYYDNDPDPRDLVRASLSWTLGVNLEDLTLTGVRGISGTGNSLGNVITGNRGANTLTGLNGADLLHGLGKADRLFGGSGADLLDGGAGNDRLVGGAGNDRYIVSGVGDRVIELRGGGTDLASSNVTFVLPENVENLFLTGTKAANGDGNALANVVTGNSAGNILSGGAGNDRLSGAAGDDQLIGGDGKDLLSGGAGFDLFIFRSETEAGTGRGRDVLQDFQVGIDRIDLTDIDAQSASRGNQKFTFVGRAAFSDAAGEVRYAGGFLSGDTDGDRLPDFTIEVSGRPALSETDFLL